MELILQMYFAKHLAVSKGGLANRRLLKLFLLSSVTSYGGHVPFIARNFMS